jgi:histidine triad (HIT) family protein
MSIPRKVFLLTGTHSVVQLQLYCFRSETRNCLVENCIFCKMVEGVEPAHKIWESEQFLAFPSIHPCNPGHTCLIPKAHVDYVFDLEEPLYFGIFQAAKQISKPLKEATSAKRIGIAVEGFSVPHVHIHLVPLYNVAELDPHRHVKQNAEELAATAEKIRKEIVKGKT